MSSVTAVPLRPIARGSLTWLWIGIVIALALACYLGWRGVESTVQRETTASGLQYRVVEPGDGAGHPTVDDVALVAYKGMLTNGKVFDQQERAPVELSKVIPGWTEGLQLMSKGAKYRFWIPAKLAYGATGAGADIPPNSDLVFDVTLIDFIPAAVLQHQMQQMQQQQGMSGALGAVPAH